MQNQKDILRTSSANNYCLKCWLEFTTLTDEERAVLNKIQDYINPPEQKKTPEPRWKKHRQSDYRLYCLTNKTYYKSVVDAGKKLDISPVTIYQALQGKYKNPHWKFEWRLKNDN